MQVYALDKLYGRISLAVLDRQVDFLSSRLQSHAIYTMQTDVSTVHRTTLEGHPRGFVKEWVACAVVQISGIIGRPWTERSVSLHRASLEEKQNATISAVR